MTSAAAYQSSATASGTTAAAASAMVRVRSGTMTDPAAAAARSDRLVRPAITMRPRIPRSAAGAIMSMAEDAWSGPPSWSAASTKLNAVTAVSRAAPAQNSLARR